MQINTHPKLWFSKFADACDPKGVLDCMDKDCLALLAHAARGAPNNHPFFQLVGGDDSHTEAAAGRVLLPPHLVGCYGSQGIPQLPPG